MRGSTVAGLGLLATGGAVVTGITMLLDRNQRPTLEIKSYVHGIRDAAEGWGANTEQLMGELRRMPEQAARVGQLTAAYVEARERS